jgi:hypothetical protein
MLRLQIDFGYRETKIGKGKNLDNLTWTTYDKETLFSFIGKDLDIISNDLNGQYMYIYNKKNEIIYNIKLNYWILARAVGYLYDDTKILISVYDSNPRSMITKTFFINLEQPDEQYEIILDDKKYSPYKCVFDSLTNDLYFTHRKSLEFEDREIMMTNRYTFKKCIVNDIEITKIQ